MIDFRVRVLTFGLILLVVTFLANGYRYRDLYKVQCGTFPQPHPRGLCGSRLADKYFTVCAYLRYKYPHIFNKRSAPALESSNPLNMMQQKTKRSCIYKTVTDLVCECCYLPCTVRKIAAYC